MFIGCNIKKDDNGNTTGYGIQIMTVGGCQYVVFNGSNKAAMTHHGTCNNPIHIIFYPKITIDSTITVNNNKQ